MPRGSPGGMESIDFNPRHETIARDNCSPSPRARSDRTRHVHVTADEPDARGTVRRTRAGPSLSEHVSLCTLIIIIIIPSAQGSL